MPIPLLATRDRESGRSAIAGVFSNRKESRAMERKGEGVGNSSWGSYIAVEGRGVGWRGGAGRAPVAGVVSGGRGVRAMGRESGKCTAVGVASSGKERCATERTRERVVRVASNRKERRDGEKWARAEHLKQEQLAVEKRERERARHL